MTRLPVKLTFFLQSLALLFFASCSRIDHKQSALDPKGLVAQNQYDIFMLSVWITIFLFCAVEAVIFVVWSTVQNPKRSNGNSRQIHGSSKIETTLV